ncbi:WD40 repeat-like protein [Suillus decipiens]|nr:WD40 repeat-like protein [Suillus decipiens]
MKEEEQPVIRITKATQKFKGHENSVFGVAVSPDRCHMMTASADKTVRLWDLESGVVLKKMEGHRRGVRALGVSRNGQWIASGDCGGELIAWNRDGESLIQPIKAHSEWITSLDFTPDNTFLASGSSDETAIIWNTKTWQAQGNPINCRSAIHCVRYSPSGEHLAIATDDIQIWNTGTRECIAKFKGHESWIMSLAWTPNGKQLISAGGGDDPTIRIWDSSTWNQIGEPCKGHTDAVEMIALNPTGTLLASASDDQHVRIWRLSDRQTIAVFKHTDFVSCVTFSMDGKHILSGGKIHVISKWAVPSPEDILKDHSSNDGSWEDTPKEQVAHNVSSHAWLVSLHIDHTKVQQSYCEILAIDTAARNACITGDLSTADRLLTKELNNDSNDYNSYANRSFVMARKADWDRALDDALKAMSIQPSLMGCISKGIALCGKRQFQNAMKAFDLGFLFVDANLKKTHLLLLIKAIALFNANEHEEAILRVQDLATTCPNVDTLACQIVEAYLHVQLGLNVLDGVDGVRHSEAADHFTRAVNTIRFSSMSSIHSKYDVFVVVGSLEPNCKLGFHPLIVLFLAIRVGPHILVENCTPELVPCAPSSR